MLSGRTLTRDLRARIKERFDTWLRLRRWVRWLCGIAIVIATGLLATMLIGHRPPPVSPAITVKLSGPPASPVEAAPVDPATLAALVTARNPLKAAPFDGLAVATPDGMLPRKAADGVTPLQAYAHPSPALPGRTKKLSIVVLELGLSDRLTQPALALPAPVTLAYDATASDLATQINAARAAGHEIILDMPMEPKTYPLDDPGPDTLLSNMPPKTLVRQFRALLARAPGAIAVTTRSGNYFTSQSAALWPLLQDLGLRGLGWISLTDAGPDINPENLSMAVAEKLAVPAAQATLTLDSDPSDVAVQAQFEKAVAQADKDGTALVVVHAYPAVLAQLDQLLKTLPMRNIALVPASALMKAVSP